MSLVLSHLTISISIFFPVRRFELCSFADCANVDCDFSSSTNLQFSMFDLQLFSTFDHRLLTFDDFYDCESTFSEEAAPIEVDRGCCRRRERRRSTVTTAPKLLSEKKLASQCCCCCCYCCCCCCCCYSILNIFSSSFLPRLK